MRPLTVRLEDNYYSITVANHQLITVIRFVVKSYTHPWKSFANKLRLVLHACNILFSEIVRATRAKQPPKIKDVAATWTWWLILVMSINRVLVWFSFVFTAAKKKWCLCSSRCSVATKHARIGRWLEEGATCPDPRGLDLFLDLETSNLPERSGLAMPIPRHSGTGTYYTFLRPCLVKKKVFLQYPLH